MKVKEYSRIAPKYINPESFLTSLFPRFEECQECHSMIALEHIRDVHHASYTHEHAAYRKDWLQWKCIVCGNTNEFSNEEVIVSAHRRMVRSSYDFGEAFFAFVVVAIILFFAASPLFL